MGRLTAWIDATFYPGHQDNWDAVSFRRRLLDILEPESRLLDLGAGTGRVRQMDFRRQAARVCGVDLDPRVLDNPYLDEAKIAAGDAIPYPDESFDVVLAYNVLEHLEDPTAVFREVARVLTPGGLFLAKTPNLRHYVPLLARSTPHRFHEWINRRRGRAGADTFPTFYRANSKGAITRSARAAGLAVARLDLSEGRPEYLRFSAVPYLFGLAYERLVNGIRALAIFRVIIIAVLRKPENG